eukprot:scaffold953_cov141-Cylindrotheca_fusiformis.AAC.3
MKIRNPFLAIKELEGGATILDECKTDQRTRLIQFPFGSNSLSFIHTCSEPKPAVSSIVLNSILKRIQYSNTVLSPIPMYNKFYLVVCVVVWLTGMDVTLKLSSELTMQP